MATHKFKVGQSIILISRNRTAPGEYRIVAQVPPDSVGPQYRIKNRSEPHDRIAREEELRALGPVSSGD